MAKKKTKKRATKRSGKASTADKQAYVKSLVASQSGISMSAAGKKVIEKYGTMLAFDKLREAFKAAGGKVGKRGPKSGTAKKTKSAKTPSRRGVGRRNADVRASVVNKALSGLPTHMVVVQEGAKSIPNIFSTGKQAEAYVKKLLENGVSPGVIAYYERRPMGVRVEI